MQCESSVKIDIFFRNENFDSEPNVPSVWPLHSCNTEWCLLPLCQRLCHTDPSSFLPGLVLSLYLILKVTTTLVEPRADLMHVLHIFLFSEYWVITNLLVYYSYTEKMVMLVTDIHLYSLLGPINVTLVICAVLVVEAPANWLPTVTPVSQSVNLVALSTGPRCLATV